MNIEERVYQIVVQIRELDYQLDELGNKELFKDLAFDSVDVMNLISKLEKEFQIFFAHEEIMELTKRFQDIVDLIEKKLRLQ